MRLVNNPEIVRLIVGLGAVLLLLGLLVIGWAWYSAQKEQRLLTNHQAALLGVMIDHDPALERQLIQQVKDPDHGAITQGKALLARYGLVQAEGKMMEERVKSHLARYGLLTAAVFAVLTGLFFIFLSRHYRKLNEITSYLGRIAAGEDSLDVRDNEEGEFSLLKNEIYKITTRLKEQAVQSQRDKMRLSEALADISHQLKTPLTGLILLSDLLEEDPDEEMKNEFLNRIRAQLKRMEWLTTSLLKLSRLETGTVQMERVSFPIKELVHHALQAVSIPLELKEQQVKVNGDETLQVRGDRQWLGEALINMLKNHIEHTPERGVIRINYEATPLYTKISTADEGEGIDPEDLPYIFNRFYRGNNAREESAGIGLAMAYEIVKQQGGDLTVKSERGKGTQFTITLYHRSTQNDHWTA